MRKRSLAESIQLKTVSEAVLWIIVIAMRSHTSARALQTATRLGLRCLNLLQHRQHIFKDSDFTPDLLTSNEVQVSTSRKKVPFAMISTFNNIPT
jgi:hypothetical protein